MSDQPPEIFSAFNRMFHRADSNAGMDSLLDLRKSPARSHSKRRRNSVILSSHEPYLREADLSQRKESC
jgi:hypothetical protein